MAWRIGVLSTSYPRHDGDAAGRFVKDLADGLADRGHSLEILFAEDGALDHPARDGAIALRAIPYLRPRRLEQSFYGDGVPEKIARAPLSPALWAGLISYPPLLALTLALRRGRYDALLSHFLLPSGLIASAIDLPQIAIAHSADLHLLERLPLRRLIARRIDQRAQLLFISEAARARFERVLGQQTRLEPIVSPMAAPALPKVRREEARDALGLSRDALIIASLGRLVPIKGHQDAIDALEGVRGAHYLIGGEGPLRSALKARAESRGVRLSLLGPLDALGKARLFAATDRFVHPSITLEGGRAEGVPVALLEALSAGLPAIATQTGGVASSFKESAQLSLIPERDIEALRAALLQPMAPSAASDPNAHLIQSAGSLAERVEAALATVITRERGGAAQGRTTSVRRGGE